MLSRRDVLIVLVLTLAAAGLRIAHVRQLEIGTLRGDTVDYIFYATNLVNHGVYSKDREEPVTPDSFRSPGYPFFLAAIRVLTPDEAEYRTALVVQAMLGSLLVLLTYALGRQMMPSWAAGVAAGLTAFSPHLVTMTGYILTETLFSVTLTGAVLAFYLLGRRPKVFRALVCGAAFAVAYLVNEAALFLPLALVAVAALAQRARGASSPLRPAHLALVAGLVITAWLGWTIRGRISVPAGGATNTQRALISLTHGSYPGFVYENDAYKYAAYKEDPAQPAFSSSLSNFVEVFTGRVKERPLRHLSWYIFEKPFHLWRWRLLQGFDEIYVYPTPSSLYVASGLADGTRIAMRFAHPFVVLLALSSVVLAGHALLRQKIANPITTNAFVVAGLLYFTVLYAVLNPLPRYSIPLRPFLYICASYAVFAFVRRMGAREVTVSNQETGASR